MHAQAEASVHLLDQLLRPHLRTVDAGLLEERQHFRGELMSAPRAGPSALERWYAAALEGFLGLVKDRAGEAEGPGRGGHGPLLLLDAAQHLVLDLHHVAAVEEGETALEQLVSDALGMRMDRPVSAQGLQLRIRPPRHVGPRSYDSLIIPYIPPMSTPASPR